MHKRIVGLEHAGYRVWYLIRLDWIKGDCSILVVMWAIFMTTEQTLTTLGCNWQPQIKLEGGLWVEICINIADKFNEILSSFHMNTYIFLTVMLLILLFLRSASACRVRVTVSGQDTQQRTCCYHPSIKGRWCVSAHVCIQMHVCALQQCTLCFTIVLRVLCGVRERHRKNPTDK